MRILHPVVRLFVVILLSCSALTAATSPDGLWRNIDEQTLVASGASRVIVPKAYETVALNKAALLLAVAQAPLEFTPEAALKSVTLTLPTPDGLYHRFRIQESPMMEPALAAKYPLIRTYSGQGIDDATATLRFSITPDGFHAIVLSAAGTFLIDPYTPDDLVHHVVYWKRHYYQDKEWTCLFESANESRSMTADALAAAPSLSNGATLKTYRLALAATGEYTQFHGGTKARALSRGMIPTMNRVNAVYGRELSVRMTLVDNTLIIFENPTADPYENNNPTALLAQNIAVCDALVGPHAFDIGHVFSTGGGGVALLGSVCGAQKAGGVTGTRNPIGDPYDIDYVAHEMGHQFGGNHTFNGSVSNCAGSNRSASHAYEVGSGSTIQAYAGICPPQNLQPNSDDYFHYESLREMSTFITSGGGAGCAVTAATGNTLPTVNGGPDFNIPKQTAFTLTASGSDADGDALTYCWEEFDLGATGDGKTDNGSSPIFRSFLPRVTPSRTFPQLSDILNKTTTYGEIYPNANRTLKFKVTVRDNRSNGAFSDDHVDVTVRAAAGPFVVTEPNINVLWAQGSTQTVTWNVAGTDQAPISTSAVHIYLSTDGGLTFPTVLASSTPNDGSESVTLPSVITDKARIKIAAAGNIYFDISDVNFHIGATASEVTADSATFMSESCLPANQAIDDDETVTLNIGLKNTGVPTTNLVATLLATGGVTSPDGAKTYGVIGTNETVTQPFTFTSDSSCGGTLTATLELVDNGIPLGSVSITFVSGLKGSADANIKNINPMIFVVDPGVGAAPGYGPSSLYPSPITVANFTAPVTKVIAIMRGIDHTWAEDIDAMLVSPSGTAVMLMSDVGGPVPANEVTLTFDDEAAAPLTTSALTTGTYKPTNIGAVDDMPPQAPANANASSLAAFNGVSPNGVWNLWAADDQPLDGGTIYGGWALTIMSRTVECCIAKPGTLQFSAANYNVAEGGTATITVTRTDGAVGTVAVNYATSNGTSTAGTDYTAASGTLTFTEGQKSKTFTVATTNDNSGEQPETVTLTLTNATGGALLGASNPATLTITDTDPGATVLTRGPYLQRGTPTSMVIRWRTNVPTDSRVRYGVAPDALSQTADLATPSADHTVTLTGLTPSTRYYYSIGSTTETFLPTTALSFVTAPSVGSTQPVRIWAIGDSGNANATQQAVRDSYAAFTGSRGTDVWLMLGDNAYTLATDAEYQTAMYGPFAAMLRNNVLWPTFGNHEGLSSQSNAQAGPYYDMFTLPAAAEAGGVASGTEAYYSFNYGNIHFVCLNSHDILRTTDGAMATWLQQDLAANTQDWTIAYWHHPPYSFGGHNSDNPGGTQDTPESALSIKEMRENILPILETAGVDLVLTGHSHDYERSFLLDGHYGLSSTLTNAMRIDNGDGRLTGTGPYRKTDVVAADGRKGAVYIVNGAASSATPVTKHPVMIEALQVAGSLVIDVENKRLEGTYIDSTGVTKDRFTIVKGAKLQWSAPTFSNNEPLLGVNVTVSRTGDTTGEISVDYATSDGTATAGSDYTASSGRITFRDGETTQIVTIPVTDDAIQEGFETINLTLSNPTRGVLLGLTTATATILDNDEASTVVLGGATFTVNETAGTISIPVTRSGGTANPATVAYATADGSANGSDYTATAGTLSFAPTETLKTIIIPILDDSDAEVDQTFTLTLSNPSAGLTIGTPAVATVTIVSDDVAAIPSIGSLSPTSICQGVPGFTLTVTGTNFEVGAVVQVNGADRSTTRSGATQLTAQIPASDVASPGSLSIRVVNPGPVNSNVATVVVNADTTAPVVTAPAPITVLQSTCSADGGTATDEGSPALAAFLVDGSATDNCGTPARLVAQVSGNDATRMHFPSGSTTVTFRFVDGAGQIGTATSTVTVRLFGDMNLTNSVEASDLVIIANYLVGNMAPGTGEFKADLASGDPNGDTKVNAVDLVMIANNLVGNIPCLAD